MKKKLLLFLIWALALTSSPGQSPSNMDEFRDLYNAGHKKIIAKYVTNKEIVADITIYNEFGDSGEKTGTANTRHKIRVVSDGLQSRVFFEKSTDAEFDGIYMYKTKDSVFNVRPNGIGKWSIKKLVFNDESFSGYEWCGYANVAKSPSCGQSFNHDLFVWLNSPSSTNKAAIHPELLESVDDMYNETDVVKISGKLKALQLDKTFVDYNCYFYVDPADFYSTVGFSTDFYKAMGSTVPRKSFMNIEYFKERGVKKYPKKYVEYDEFAGGTKVPRMQIDFVEVKDYVPSSDDFELEKRFGLPTPTRLSEKPSSFIYGWAFWLVISGVFLVVLYLFLNRNKKEPKYKLG